MVNFNISFDINFSNIGKLTVGNIAKAIFEADISCKVIKALIENADEEAVIGYCGEKYARGNGDNRYQRANSFTRIVKTVAGEIELTLHKVKDTHKDIVFTPVYEKIVFQKHKNHQEDISYACADISTMMTFRDVVKGIGHFIKEKARPSHTTVWRMTKEHGKKMKEFRKEKNKKKHENGLTLDHFSADDTKSHSQQNGEKKNNIRIGWAVDENGNNIFLGLKVNKPWSSLKKEIDESGLLALTACLVADGEKALRQGLLTDEMDYQIDTIHYIRDTGYKLWEDNILNLDQRKEIIKELQSIVYHLVNSSKKYADNEKELQKRINQCVDELKDLADKLFTINCVKASNFIKNYSNYAITYVKLALEGKNIPWNSNVIERVMGEIQKRIKHKWMRWGTEGLETLLNLILTKYADKKMYEEYKNHTLQNQNLKNIKITTKITQPI